MKLPSRVQAAFRTINRSIGFTLLLLAFCIGIMWELIMITVPPGFKGVRWWRFWGAEDIQSPVLNSGLHINLPWNKIFTYDVRLLTHTSAYDVITKEGLPINVEITFRWFVVQKNLPRLHAWIGPDYVSRLLVPEIGSVARARLANYTAEEIYSSKRAQVQHDVYASVISDTNQNGITQRGNNQNLTDLVGLNDVLISGIQLPERVRAAIEQKVELAQVVEEYKFRVDREKLESDRKAIEADGIRRFQEAVKPGIFESYLRWRGIDATQKLSESNNAKIIVMGNGPGGLPIILNSSESSAGTATQPADPKASNAKDSGALPAPALGR